MSQNLADLAPISPLHSNGGEGPRIRALGRYAKVASRDSYRFRLVQLERLRLD